MSTIDANLDYSYIALLQNNQYQLIENGPLTGEYVAGAIIGLLTLFYHVAGKNPTYTIEIKSITGQLITLDLLDPNKFITTISNFMVVEGVLPSITVLQYAHYIENDCGWWIRSSYNYNEDRYNLYRFRSSDFVSGLIDMFNHFKYDFRDYILGPPFVFDFTTKQPVYTIVAGYDIKIFNPIPPVHPTLMPFENFTYETGDVDYA